MKLQRDIKKKIKAAFNESKVIILTGARRTGKTFLLNEIKSEIEESFLDLNGEDTAVQELFERRSVQNYKSFIGENKYLFIDEAQNVPEIGKALKLIVDNIPGIKILITGSSAFDIKNITGEPLTGRSKNFTLYPFSENEYNRIEKPQERKDNLNSRLVYGNYPELIHLSTDKEKAEYLREIVNSYLLKDILTFENLRSSDKILNLLRLIAFQIGGEVSLEEAGKNMSISKNTVKKYLDLLSKVFVVYRLTGFSRNLRKEITKKHKWYFFDNGIRNAIIANFNALNLRDDTGKLWENYMISERMKYQSNTGMIVNNFFWRTYDKQEIDLVEEREGKLFAYEMKWKDSKSKVPAGWKEAYPNSEFSVVSSENYRDFLT